MFGTWHYHFECGNKFKLGHRIAFGELCPKCNQPFAEIVRYTCNGCRAPFYTDRLFDIGTEWSCPIHGGPVVTVSLNKETFQTSQRIAAQLPGFIRTVATLISIFGSFIFKALLVVVVLFAFFVILNWLVIGVESIQLLGAEAIQNITIQIEETSRLIAVQIESTAKFIFALLTYLASATLAGTLVIFLIPFLARLVEPFNRIYQVGLRRNQLERLKTMYELPQAYPDHLVWRKSLEQTRDVIRNLLIISCLLIISSAIAGFVVGFLICFYAGQVFEETRRTVQQFIALGAFTVIFFAFIYYTIKTFFKLDQTLASSTKFRKGAILAIIFGMATTLTMIVLPPLLGEEIFSGSTIAIGLTINLIGDIIISFYEIAIDFFWKKPTEILYFVVMKLWTHLKRFIDNIGVEQT